MACFLKVLAWLLVVLLFLHYSLRLAAVAASLNFFGFPSGTCFSFCSVLAITVVPSQFRLGLLRCRVWQSSVILAVGWACVVRAAWC